MERKTPRKRIQPKKGLLLPIEDPDAYVKNKCSERARKIKTIKPNFDFNLWFDKHYQIRTQFGDEHGIREGIEAEKVESLVNRAMNHLMTYSAILKNFVFINHGENGKRNERVILQEETPEGLLNIVIEVHLIEAGIYEVTVKTAMCITDFNLSDGQFAIQLVGNKSILKRREQGAMKMIYFL
ncbi:hypothetical protein [Filimonas effusa]|uniref:Uncharacterized protein n=1 Tax=Filimonas effusa TaxID=2508721 RepID=A0A4Q1D683_9BACT|nr:hypothetical protein [Filimonas effusa]RXK83476.1 hypothetical protein ESB13_15390 [Filimonas effusa]